MSTIEESIDVEVPVRTAYNQWTQFEEFPQFMEGVESRCRQVDDRGCTGWPSIGGVRREWDAEITEQHPDERVAWTPPTAPTDAGVVTFHRLDDDAHAGHAADWTSSPRASSRTSATRSASSTGGPTATSSASRSSSSRAAPRPAPGAATSRTDPPVPPGPAARLHSRRRPSPPASPPPSTLRLVSSRWGRPLRRPGELGPLLVSVSCVALDGAGEAALRAEAELVERRRTWWPRRRGVASSSNGSSSGRLLVTRPSTTVLSAGTRRSGAKSPERSSSYSRK